MAATLFSIEVDFNKAKAQASQLEEIARGIDNMAKNDMENCMAGVSANWKGDSAALYIKKGRQLEEEMKKSAAELRKIASTIRKVAQNTYYAERKAILAAKTRTY